MMDFIRKHDILLWITSFVAAIFLWFYVVSVQNPTTTTEFSGIGLTIEGQKDLSDSGLVITEGANTTVTVQLRGRWDQVTKVTPDKITAKLDISPAYAPGEYRLGYTVSVDVDGITVVQKNPSQIKIVVDKIISKAVPASVDFTDKMPDGYKMGDYKISPNIVTISGPEQIVSKVEYAYSKVSRADFKSDVDIQVPFVLTDADGNVVEDSSILCDMTTLTLTAPVIKVGDTPLSVEIVPSDEVSADMVNVTISPATIQLEGKNEVIDTLNTINIGKINMEKVITEGVYEYTFPVTLPNGVTASQPITNAVVKIEIKDYVLKEFTIEKSNFQMDDRFTYVSEQVKVRLLVKKENADAITAADVVLTPAVTEQQMTTPGQYMVTMRASCAKYGIIQSGKSTVEILVVGE